MTRMWAGDRQQTVGRLPFSTLGRRKGISRRAERRLAVGVDSGTVPMFRRRVGTERVRPSALTRRVGKA